MKIKNLVAGGMIAALYAVLTVALAPISYGPVQFRVAEALTLLPFYMPEAVPGLFAGCVIANCLSAYGLLDVIVGGSSTLLAACLSAYMPTLGLAALPPVIINAAAIGTLLHTLLGVPLWSTVLYVGIGEAGACFLLGCPLMKALEERGILKRRAKQ